MVRPVGIDLVFWFNSIFLIRKGKNELDDFKREVGNGGFSTSQVNPRAYGEKCSYGVFGYGAIPKVNFKFITHTLLSTFKEN